MMEKKQRDELARRKMEEEETRRQEKFNSEVAVKPSTDQPIWKVPIEHVEEKPFIDPTVRINSKFSDNFEIQKRQNELEKQKAYQEDLKKQAEDAKKRKAEQLRKEREEELKYERQYQESLKKEEVGKKGPEQQKKAQQEAVKILESTLVTDIPAEPFIPSHMKTPPKKKPELDTEIDKWRKRRHDYSESDSEEDEKRWSRNYKAKEDKPIKDTLKEVIAQVKHEFTEMKIQLMHVSKEGTEEARKSVAEPEAKQKTMQPEPEESHLDTESTFLYPKQDEHYELPKTPQTEIRSVVQKQKTPKKVVTKAKTPRKDTSWTRDQDDSDDDMAQMFKENEIKLGMLANIEKTNVDFDERTRMLNEYLKSAESK
jgi:hypothetical protein